MKYVVMALMLAGCATVSPQRNIASVTTGVVVPASGFICQGANLYSAAGLVTSNFNSGYECQAAVGASKNGFICQGANLYSAAGLVTSNFNSGYECQTALNGSK